MEILRSIPTASAPIKSSPARSFKVCMVFLALTMAISFQQLNEDEIKAAYLLNFTKFVEWPSTGSESADSPLNICVLGESQVADTLSRLVHGERSGNRKIQSRKLKRGDLFESCHVLFIPKSEAGVSNLLADVPPGLLTVGESEGFLRNGGIIAFIVENRRVRFDIHHSAASKASLKVSSRLLSVARSVEK